jgi:hypothetical protein
MPRSYRRLAVITSALVLAMALAGPPAQAREAAGIFDTLSAQVAHWMAAWWPWSPSPQGTVNGGHLTISHASDAVRVRGVVGARPVGAVGRPVLRPVQTTTCIAPSTDPNGCPP